MGDAAWVLFLIVVGLIRRAFLLAVFASPVVFVLTAMGDDVRQQNYDTCEVGVEVALAHDRIATPSKPSPDYEAGQELAWQSQWGDDIKRTCMTGKGYSVDDQCARPASISEINYTPENCFRRTAYAAIAAQIR